MGWALDRWTSITIEERRGFSTTREPLNKSSTFCKITKSPQAHTITKCVKQLSTTRLSGHYCVVCALIMGVVSISIHFMSLLDLQKCPSKISQTLDLRRVLNRNKMLPIPLELFIGSQNRCVWNIQGSSVFNRFA